MSTKEVGIPIPERGTPYVPPEHWKIAEEAPPLQLPTPFDIAPMSILPRLTADQKVELRTVAPMVLAGARSAVGTITTIAVMQPRGVFEACALSACSSFASLASSLALLGAAVALAVCNDGEEPDPRSQTLADLEAKAAKVSP